MINSLVVDALRVIHLKVRIVFVLLTLVFLGCAGQSEKSPSNHAKTPVITRVSPATANMESKLLSRAEEAFRLGYLTQPAHENAYDLFQSVLVLNPENQLARSGVQAILIRFAELIREATRQQKFSKGKRLLTRAASYFPGNNLLVQLDQELRKSQTRHRRLAHKAPDLDPTDQTISRYPLSNYALQARSEKLSEFIAMIAQRLVATKESVLIHAPTDAQGRWVYSKLNAATVGYRVRGDIRLARKASLELLPPLQ